jgi:hypothetical protein
MVYGNCILPGGYIDDDNHRHREVELAPLSGHEEELLAANISKGAAAQVTAILARCVKQLGTLDRINEDLMRKLLVGDRQFLMLKLRAITFGERVQATTTCPWSDCGTEVDVDFNISDIQVEDAGLDTQLHRMDLDMPEEGRPKKIWFRLPNGSDQENLNALASDNPAEISSRLLWRCIQRIDDQQSPDLEQIRKLSSSVRIQIESQMQTLAPDVDLTMETCCPQCQRDFTIPFDIQSFFFGEMHNSRELLRREIHYLAYHYHWSEQDILSMTRDRRQQYIDILSDEIERMNAGVQHSAAR